jgi:hypothetical protein
MISKETATIVAGIIRESGKTFEPLVIRGALVDWTDSKSCQERDSKIFTDGGRHNTIVAKTICNACAVVAPCLETGIIEAVDTRAQRRQIWGGTTGSERIEIMQNRLYQ